MALFELEGGAGDASAAPVTPSVSPTDSGQAQATPSQDGNTPQVSATPVAPAIPAGNESPLLFTLPNRGTPEYWDAFNKLSESQRSQVEREFTAFERGDLKPTPKAPDPMVAPLPGDTPVEAVPQVIDQEVFEGLKSLLPPEKHAEMDRIFGTISEMQDVIEQAKPYLDPNTQRGLQLLMNDPVVKARSEEIAKGEMYRPEALASLQIDFESILKDVNFEGKDPDTDPEGFKGLIESIIQRSVEQGARQGYLKAEYKAQESQALERRVSSFKQGIDGIISKNPSLRPSDQNVSLKDANHPLNPFIQWVRDPALGDKFIEKVGMEAAYMTFLSQTGQLQKTIQTVATNERFNFIKKMDQVSRDARNLGANSGGGMPQNSNPMGQGLPGVDSSRYINDPTYAWQVFNSADAATRIKLEALRRSGGRA